MSVDEKQFNSTVSKQAEEEHLKKTLRIIQHNMQNYGADVSRMREQIDEMLEHFHDDNPELINQLENTITMHDHLKRALERNEKAQKKPYFGRVIFKDENTGQEESLYIGRGGILEDATHIAVVDWRAPVANTYYENGLGKCSYTAPDGSDIPIDLTLKRTYEIEEGNLLNYYDTEVIANDDLLTKYLSKNKEAVLGEIVATIQKEQNDIIRKSPYHNCIVQGVAGSGKTTVAMHRISYILYNYQERFKPEDFYIVGSNRILLNYITSVLPDLDVYGVKQMTMEQLFIRLLYEDWDDKKYGIRELERGIASEAVKGTLKWFRDLEAYCNRLENEVINCDDIYLEPMEFVEGYENGKFGVFNRSQNIGSSEYRHRSLAHKKQSVLLVDFESVDQYVSQNPTISIQTKINTLNDRLIMKINDEFLGKGVKYTETEKKAILKAYRGKYGPNVWKTSIFDMYLDFLNNQMNKGFQVKNPFSNNTKRSKILFDVYDLAALAFLYKRVKETEVISEAHHVVVDEAQDYGMMAYSVLKFCIKDCTYTIMGDVSQNIHFGYGLNDWEALKRLYMSTDRASFDTLKKSYRNTIEISNFATNILKHGSFHIYPVEPIIRHGEPVKIIEESSEAKLFEKTAEICNIWQSKGLETIAIICRDQKEASYAAEKLRSLVSIMESDPEKTEFGKGIMVLPVAYTKGLEFDAVLILNPSSEAYPKEDGHAKLLYVAATRALHELCIIHLGNISELLTAPSNDHFNRLNGMDVQEFIEKDKTRFDENRHSNRAGYVRTPFSGSENNIEEKREQKRPVAILSQKDSSLSQQLSSDIKSNNQQSQKVVVKPVIKTKVSASINKSGCSFGDIPGTEQLLTPGHAKTDISIRWIEKKTDGIYLHSRFGVLRISPVHSSAVRITFARGTQITSGTTSRVRLNKLNKFCRYNDTSKFFTFMNDEILLQIDKSTGLMSFLNRDKKLLLIEQEKNPRQFFEHAKGNVFNRTFWKFRKDERIFAHRIADKVSENLRGKARYISHNSLEEELPLLISDQGYGILTASEEPVFFCDIPAYGSFIHTEKASQIDFYFIVGSKTDNIIAVYEELLGR